METNPDSKEGQSLLTGQPAWGGAAADDVIGDGHDLHRLLAMAFGGMLILSFGLSVLLAWQIRVAHLQIVQNRTLVTNFQKLDEPQVKMVLSKLQAYSVSHPAFGVVLARYPIFFTARLTTNAPAASNPPARTTSPPASQQR